MPRTFLIPQFFSGAVDEHDHEREVTRWKAVSHTEEPEKRPSSKRKNNASEDRPVAAKEEDNPHASSGDGDDAEVAESISHEDLPHEQEVGTTGKAAHGGKAATTHQSQSRSTKVRKPDPFGKQRRDFEMKQQAQIDLEKQRKEQKKKLRVDRYNRFKKKTMHMQRTPKGQLIMKNVLASLMAKYEK